MKLKFELDLAIHPSEVRDFIEEKGRATISDIMVHFNLNNHQAHDIVAVLFLKYRLQPKSMKGQQKFPIIVWKSQKQKPRKQGSKGVLNKAARRKERNQLNRVPSTKNLKPMEVNIKKEYDSE